MRAFLTEIIRSPTNNFSKKEVNKIDVKSD